MITHEFTHIVSIQKAMKFGQNIPGGYFQFMGYEDIKRKDVLKDIANLEKELKQNLSLKNVSVNRELFPFGLKVHINSRIPIAYGERILNDEKILGFIDKDGIFINKQNVDEKNLNKLTIKVFGWKEKFKKILSEIFIAIDNYELEIVKITFSSDGFLTVEEKDLKTIFLGLKPNLINYQLQIINNLKNEFKKSSFSKKIDNIDLTNPDKPKIKVFKP